MTTAPTRAPPTRTGGRRATVEFDRINRPGFYGWPYCSARNDAYNEYTFPSGPSRREVQLRRWADEQLAQQHRHHHAAAGQSRPGCRTAAPARRRSSAAAGLSPMGGPVYRYDPNNTSDREVPGVLRRQRTSPASSAAAGSRTSRSTPTARPLKIEPVPVDRHRRSWTWSSARTARSTCSTTAPAGSAATPTRRSTASSTPARARAPIAKAAADPDLRRRAADRAVLLGGHASTRTATRSPTPGTSTTTAPPTRPRPTRRFTYTTNGERTATLTVRDTTRQDGRPPASSSRSATAPRSVTLNTPLNGQTVQLRGPVPF